jgi:hypothetical protein
VTRSGPRPNNSGELLSEKTIVEQDGPFSWPILFSVKAYITEAQRSRKRASLVIFFQSDPIVLCLNLFVILFNGTLVITCMEGFYGSPAAMVALAAHPQILAESA